MSESTNNRFVTLRVEKLHTDGKISATLAHNFRTAEPENADPEKKADNWQDPELAQDPEQSWAMIRERLKECEKGRKIKEDQVLAAEYVVGYSPGALERDSEAEDAYFQDTIKWLKEKHGSGMISAHIHKDEVGGNHLHAVVVPEIREMKKDKERVRLSFGHHFDGSWKLSKIQDEIGEIGVRHSLERGIKGSIAKHSRVKRSYGAMDLVSGELPEFHIPKPPKDLGDKDPDEWVLEKVQDQLRPAWEAMAEQAGLAKLYKAEMNEMNRKAKKLAQTKQHTLMLYEEILDGKYTPEKLVKKLKQVYERFGPGLGLNEKSNAKAARDKQAEEDRKEQERQEKARKRAENQVNQDKGKSR